MTGTAKRLVSVRKAGTKTLPELPVQLDRLNNYEFIDEHNRGEARYCAEGLIHSCYINEPRQAVLQAKELWRVVNYDRALKVKEFFRGRGAESKIFCVHEPLKKQEKAFRVRGLDFDWHVRNLNESDEKVPAEFMRNLSLLKKAGIRVNGIAVAAPVKHAPLKKIVKEEFTRAGINFLISLGLFILFPLALLSAADPDPVLLIRIGPYYIEGGRWV